MALSGLLFSLIAMTSNNAPAPLELEILATTQMVADITRQVVGKHGVVEALMGEGVDPHLYKPTVADARSIMNADLIFYSGLKLEGRMTDAFTKASKMGKKVFPVTELIDKSFLLEPSGSKGHWDPHVWMDVSAWSHAVDAVATAMSTEYPAYSDNFHKNATTYKNQLARLHEYAIHSIATIPVEKRVLITAHDAFNYFGRAYNIEVIGIQGLSTESEAGIEDINRLVNFIVEQKISAVFVESSVSERSVNSLIEGAKAQGHALEIGGMLYSDAMGQKDAYTGSYIGMLDHNITLITTALGGEAPAGGFAEFVSESEVEQQRE